MRRLQAARAGLLRLAEAILVLRMNEHEESRCQKEEDRRRSPTCHCLARKVDVLLTKRAGEAAARGMNTRDSKGYCGIPRK